MKITNYDVIKSGERELIDAITGDLDWGAIEEIIKEEHKLEIDENVEYKKGDIVVYNDQVAYKLEFDVKVVLSVLLDREGNYLSVTSSGKMSKSEDNDENSQIDETEKPKDIPDNETKDSSMSSATDTEENISKMTSQAEEMVSEIQNEEQAATEM
jgi:hypothetical protein